MIMAEPSLNNINLYKHYLEIAPKKARQAAVLLKMFPSLGEEDEENKEQAKGLQQDEQKPKG